MIQVLGVTPEEDDDFFKDLAQREESAMSQNYINGQQAKSSTAKVNRR